MIFSSVEIKNMIYMISFDNLVAHLLLNIPVPLIPFFFLVLAIEVSITSSNCHFSQSKYMLDLLRLLKLDGAKHMSTPMAK